VRIDICNPRQEPLFTVQVDAEHPPSVVKPPEGSAHGQEVYLDWDQALDDRGHLRRCPVCGCRELFVRKNFPQVTGLLIVVFAGVVATYLALGKRQVIAAGIVLLTVALIDALIFMFTGKCVVCYRCRSTFRGLPIGRDQRGWELSTGEKYRQQAGAAEAEPGGRRETDETR